MNTVTPRNALNTASAAIYLGVSVSFLKRRRNKGWAGDPTECPPYVQLASNKVQYDLDELKAWIKSRRRGCSAHLDQGRSHD